MLPSEKQIETLRRLHAAGNPWARFPDWFIDQGQWSDPLPLSLLAWHATGDNQYLRLALLVEPPAFPSDRNHSRQEGHIWPLWYEQLRIHLSPEKREAWRVSLTNWGEDMLDFTRLDDSDETVGHYLGLVLIDRAILTTFSTYTHEEIGTGVGKATVPEMKAAIEGYIERSIGGVWLEGTEYNLNTLMLLCNGVAALGLDHFVGFRSFLPDLAKYLRWSVTDDLKDTEQHGDIQHPHSPEWHYRLTLMCQVIALGGDQDGELAKLVAEVTKHVTVPEHLYPYWLGLSNALWLDFDPSKLPTPGSYQPPRGTFVAPGYGLVLHRTEQDFVQVRLSNRTLVDHDGDAGSKAGGWGDVRWWHKGEWVLDHPIGYQSPVWDYNTCVPAGLDHLLDRNFLVAQPKGEDLHAAGVMFTPYQVPGTFTTLTFLNQGWYRTVLFEGGAFRIVDKYACWEPVPQNGQPHLWEARFFAHSEPGHIALGTFRWGTPGGQIVTLQCQGADDSLSAIEKRGDWWIIRLFSDELENEIETVIEVEPPNSEPVPVPQPEPPAPSSDPDVAWKRRDLGDRWELYCVVPK